MAEPQGSRGPWYREHHRPGPASLDDERLRAVHRVPETMRTVTTVRSDAKARAVAARLEGSSP